MKHFQGNIIAGSNPATSTRESFSNRELSIAVANYSYGSPEKLA